MEQIVVEAKTCRICLDDEEEEPLISPCACSGTSKYVHGSCLATYRRMFPKMDVRRVRCAVCKADYTVEVHGFSAEAFEQQLLPPVIIRERDHREDDTSPMVYIVANFMLLVMNVFWAGFCFVSPPIAQCTIPCFWGWLFFGLHMLNVSIYSMWYKSCTIFTFGVPAGFLLSQKGNIIVYSTVTFNAFQLLMGIISTRARAD